MYMQTIATILMDDEIHDILNEDNSFQEYIFISECEDIENLINTLENKTLDFDENNFYISATISELKQALNLLENKKIENIVFVYQN